MRAYLEIVFDWIFGCHHGHLSRVFTIGRKTYQVCLGCGAELQYSWRTIIRAAGGREPPNRAFPFSGCWTTVAGPVADSTVRAPRG